MLDKLKSLVPHVIAVVMFIVIAATYFYPQLEGYQLHQSDTDQFIGASKETADYREKFGSEPLWTNSMFGGMPTYQISTIHPNYVTPIENILILKPLYRPIGYVVLAMISFYILLLCFGVSPWLSIIGAIAFGFASINMLYLGTGHNSKVHAIALLPMVIGSILLAYRKNLWMGAILLSFFLCLQISANHLQMTYYSLFLIGAIVIVELIIHVKNKLYLKFTKTSLVLFAAAIIGILPSFSNLYTTYEYGKYSTRGKSELTISSRSALAQKEAPIDALEANYITQYSMGYGEVWSAVIPDVKGGANNYIGNKKEIMKDVNPQFREYIAQYPSYWGEQASSGGAFYFGASIFLLFILGMVFIRDPIKWAFLGASALAVLLSWKYGSILQYFIEHFPWFNKFRDTKMIMILLQISFPFIGLLFVKEMFETQINKKKLLYTLLAVNGLLVLFYILPSTFFDFQSSAEAQSFSNQLSASKGNQEYLNQFNMFVSELENARIAIFKKDVMRSLFFTLFISGLIYFFVAGKVKKNYFIVTLGILVLLDLWIVDKRYLNNDNAGKGYKMWVEKQRSGNPYRASVADNFILNNEVQNNPELGKKIEVAVSEALTKTKEKNVDIEKEKLTFRELGFATDYRVFTRENPFSNGEISYYHKSIGGYHGAKLKKYDELIGFYLFGELQTIENSLRDSTITNERLNMLLRDSLPVLNMLNTKYIIYSQNTPPLANNTTNGNCWFVKEVKFESSANDEMLSLGKENLRSTAVVNERYKADVQVFKYDSTASIKLESYKPNQLVYKSKANTVQVAVFSEIYYPKGWNVYIDGKIASYFTANYLLRAMSVPAGEHKIEFRFEPSSYIIGEKVSVASSILLLMLLLGACGFGIYQMKKK